MNKEDIGAEKSKKQQLHSHTMFSNKQSNKQLNSKRKKLFSVVVLKSVTIMENFHDEEGLNVQNN